MAIDYLHKYMLTWDGTPIQVLNEAGSDWDRTATQTAYDQWLVEHPHVFVPNIASANPASGTTISKPDFELRLTLGERSCLLMNRRLLAGLTVEDYTNPEKKNLVDFEAFLHYYDAAVILDLTEPTLSQGMDILVALNIIAANRKADLLKVG